MSAARRTASAPPGQGRLTGERPRLDATPPSLLALHDAGYRAVAGRLGPGRVLDLGCGEGFASRSLAAPGRPVVGVDYDEGALAAAAAGREAPGPGAAAPGPLALCRMDAATLGFAGGAFEWVCSSHLVEHFAEPGRHVAEVARVLAPGGTAFFLTPNAPADFENPYHVHLFDAAGLAGLLVRYFGEVWVGGIDAAARVKADFAARRAKAARLLALDVLGLRHRLPRRWYVAAYARLLPVAYRLLDRPGNGDGALGGHGAQVSAWFETGEVDETTLVLFAVCRLPRAGGPR